MVPPQDRFPWQYFTHASVHSLESYELARLTHAANLRKEIVALVDQWLDETASALLARWLLEHWAQLRGAPDPLHDPTDLEAQPLSKPPPALVPPHRGRANATG